MNSAPKRHDCDIWLDEQFQGAMAYMRPEGMLKHKYMINNMAKYLKWLERRYGTRTEYAFTLTTGCDLSEVKEEEERMIFAVNKILQQQTCPVLEGDAYLEYTEAGRPHIHGWYRCDMGHRIYQKIFKRYWPEWNEGNKQGEGIKGGYHKEMKTNKYKDYAAAEGRKVCSIIPQFEALIE